MNHHPADFIRGSRCAGWSGCLEWGEQLLTDPNSAAFRFRVLAPFFVSTLRAQSFVA